MHVQYKDIIEKAGEPDWYDQNATPRYGEFHPNAVTIYGKEVTFYRIICQSCDKGFNVVAVWPTMTELLFKTPEFGGPPAIVDSSHPDYEKYKEEFSDWCNQNKDKLNNPEEANFGDPPNHDCIGDTMGSVFFAVLEHWRKGNNMEWAKITGTAIEDTEVSEQSWF